jgi:uncharacterized Zn ribbon protein
MSSVRIRYDEVSEGKLVSRRMFTTASGVEVKVELDTAAKSYKVVNSVTGEVLASGDNVSINVAVLKIKSKEALQSLGVIFGDEKRDRTGSEATAGE